MTTEGRAFRRFLGREVPATAVLRLDIPEVVSGERTTVFRVVAAFMIAAMAGGLVVAARRRPRMVPARPAAVRERPSDALVRAIATLDATFERLPRPTDAERSDYASRRATLKRQLAELLAADRGPA